MAAYERIAAAHDVQAAQYDRWTTAEVQDADRRARLRQQADRHRHLAAECRSAVARVRAHALPSPVVSTGD